jgi:hypothetical protein
LEVHILEEKNGKVKVTFEVEINQAAMELIRANIDSMGQMLSEGMAGWREGRGQHGDWMRSHGAMHHGQE